VNYFCCRQELALVMLFVTAELRKPLFFSGRNNIFVPCKAMKIELAEKNLSKKCQNKVLQVITLFFPAEKKCRNDV